MSKRQRQNKIWETLADGMRGGRFHHAVLLEGGGAEERRELAFFLARGTLCEGTERPCGSCRHCKKIVKEIHPDVLAFGGEGGARSFHIDAVRKLRQEAFVKPNEAEGKVFLLWEIQEMSVQAQNALLKLLEEPPAGVSFVLTCENKALLLETILSRVTSFSLESANYESEQEQMDKALELLGLLQRGDELSALERLAVYERDRPGFLLLLEAMRALLADFLAGREAAGEKALEKLPTRLQTVSIIAIIDEMAAALAGNAGGLLLTTVFCSRIRCAFADRLS